MFIYWIHKPEHKDPVSEGYVGISKKPEERIKSHKRTKGTIIYNAFQKYDNLQFNILHQNITVEEAKILEKQYRPDYRIGWNICPGGGFPPNEEGEKHHNSGRRHSEKTRRILSEKKKGSNHPNYGKNLPINTRQKISNSQRGPLNHRYGKTNTEETNAKRSKALLGKQKDVVTCPHCLKSGGKPAMVRFHYDNCKELK